MSDVKPRDPFGYTRQDALSLAMKALARIEARGMEHICATWIEEPVEMTRGRIKETTQLLFEMWLEYERENESKNSD